MKIDLNSDLFFKLGLALAELLVAYILGNLVNRLIRRISAKAAKKGAFTFLASFVNIAIKIVGVIIALDQIGVSMNVIVSGLSALGLGISLALKDNMASVASGLQILLTKPFVIGDYVKVGSHEGFVRAVEMTYTLLETRNEETVIISNNKMISKMLVNYSSIPKRRISIDFSIGAADAQKGKEILYKAARESSLVFPEPEPKVIFEGITNNTVNLQLHCYSKAEDYWQAKSQLWEKIYDEEYPEDPRPDDPAIFSQYETPQEPAVKSEMPEEEGKQPEKPKQTKETEQTAGKEEKPAEKEPEKTAAKDVPESSGQTENS